MCGQVHHGLVSPIIASWANSCSWSQELLSLARTLWVNWLSQCISHQANHNELRQVSQTCVLSLAAAEGWHFWPRTTCVRGTQWHLFWKNTFSSRFVALQQWPDSGKIYTKRCTIFSLPRGHVWIHSFNLLNCNFQNIFDKKCNNKTEQIFKPTMSYFLQLQHLIKCGDTLTSILIIHKQKCELMWIN